MVQEPEDAEDDEVPEEMSEKEDIANEVRALKTRSIYNKGVATP